MWGRGVWAATVLPLAVVVGLTATYAPLRVGVALAAAAVALLLPPSALLALLGLTAGASPVLSPLVAIIAVGILTGALLAKRRMRIPPGRVIVVVVTFAALLGLSYLSSPSNGGQGILAGYLVGLLLLLLGASLPDHARLIPWLLAGGALTAVYGITRQSEIRAAVEGLNPNSLGAVLAVHVAVASALIATRRHLLVALPTGAVLLAGLFATGSRGAFAAGVAGMLVAAISTRRRLLLGLLGAGLVTLVVPDWPRRVLGALTAGRESDVLSGSVLERQVVIRVAAETMTSHPLGVGLGGFPRLSLLGINAHNEYLRVAVEAGVAALMCLLALTAVPLLMWFRRGRVALPVACGAAAWSVALLFGTFGAQPQAALVGWLLLGVLSAQVLLGHPGTVDKPRQRVSAV